MTTKKIKRRRIKGTGVNKNYKFECDENEKLRGQAWIVCAHVLVCVCVLHELHVSIHIEMIHTKMTSGIVKSGREFTMCINDCSENGRHDDGVEKK